MLKKVMKYTDYNGLDRTEDVYFNLTKAEIVEMELGVDGGLSEMLKKMSASNDIPSLTRWCKEIILKAYGEKSPDGKRFIKSEEIATAFSQTEAFSDLFITLATDAEEASNFINALIPDNMNSSATPQKPVIETIK